MGGNAVRDVCKLNSKGYKKVKKLLLPRLAKVLGNDTVIRVVKAYKHKKVFGDIDIVIGNRTITKNTLDSLINEFKLLNKDYVCTGNEGVLQSMSFRLHEFNFQVDLILVENEGVDIACHYYDYNDLSNLLGRMTKKLGFKLSHKGLFYIDRVDNQVISETRFSWCYFDALRYLKLDVHRYKQGFSTLEDIFNYVSSSPYFNADIYLLSNRKSSNSKRDAKRQSYIAFLKYCEINKGRLVAYNYSTAKDLGGYGAVNNKSHVVQQIMLDSPALMKSVLMARATYVIDKEFRVYFNGHIVKEVYKVEGKALGKLMQYFNKRNTDRVKLTTIRKQKYDFHN